MTETVDARSEILSRIRFANRRDAADCNAEIAWESIPRNYLQDGALSPSGRIDLFAERLRDYGACVFLSERSQLASTIGDVLRRRNRKKIVAPTDIDMAWLAGDADGCMFVPDNALSYMEIDSCDGVLTGCTAAIAATGTLCVCHAAGGPTLRRDSPGQGRRALTLIPDYHLCVVRAADVVETVPEAIRILEPYRTEPITLISGPSATSDIEMTRIQGVHGPRVLDVVIVQDWEHR